jgi:hypothetical protein
VGNFHCFNEVSCVKGFNCCVYHLPKSLFFTLSFRCCGLCEPAVKMLINSRDLEGCLNDEISNLNNAKILLHCIARNNLNACVDKKNPLLGSTAISILNCT